VTGTGDCGDTPRNGARTEVFESFDTGSSESSDSWLVFPKVGDWLFRMVERGCLVRDFRGWEGKLELDGLRECMSTDLTDNSKDLIHALEG
jgi:hypothetical protein